MLSFYTSTISRTLTPIVAKSLATTQLSTPTRPRIFARDQRFIDHTKRDESYLALLEKQCREKAEIKKINPIKVKDAKKMTSTSKVMTPSKVNLVKPSELPTSETKNGFGTGMMKFPKVWGKDRYVHGQVKVQKRMPGSGPFKNVLKSHYDVRAMKYLWTISNDGIYLKREMSGCASNRGIVSHPKLVWFASCGGEAWFLPDEDAVHINLNSGRFPTNDTVVMDAAAKVWLSLGYDKVYVTPLDQRYGTITPILYMVDRSTDGTGRTFQ